MPPLIDISITLRAGTPEWPGDTPFTCGWTWRLADGASVNVSTLTTSPHVGTHADAPLHVRDGARASDELPLEPFIGRAMVVDVSGFDGEIDRETLRSAGMVEVPERLLLKTGRTITQGPFPSSWPALAATCAATLAADGLQLLGVDCPSVDLRDSTALAVHHALFDGGAYILENLDLTQVSDGAYDLVAPPVKLGGLDAAPVRAVVRALHE